VVVAENEFEYEVEIFTRRELNSLVHRSGFHDFPLLIPSVNPLTRRGKKRRKKNLNSAALQPTAARFNSRIVVIAFDDDERA
jgi:hypothetical protein